MLYRPPALALAITIAVLSSPAPAQTAPAGSGNAAAPDAYRSAMEGYQPFTEQPVAPWKQSNDTVREIGGWRAYAREARPAAPASAASAPSSPASAPRTNAKP